MLSRVFTEMLENVNVKGWRKKKQLAVIFFGL